MEGTHQGWTEWAGLFEDVHGEIPALVPVGLGMTDVATKLTRIVILLEECLRLLRQIRRDTKALLEGSYKAAMNWLALAMRPGISDSDRTHYLNQACQEFIKSMGLNEHNPVLYGLTALNAGMCWLALGKRSEAIWHLEKGYRVAMTGLEQRWNAFPRKKYRRYGAMMGAGATAAGAVALASGPVGWLVFAGIFVGSAKWNSHDGLKSVNGVLELVDIVNGLRRSLIALDDQYRTLIGARAYAVTGCDMGLEFEVC